MCECGCADFHPQYKLAGPRGVLYGVSVYPGCRDCDTPAGITISRLTKADDCFYDCLVEMPNLEFWEATKDFAIPVIDKSVIISEFRKWAEGVEGEDYEVADLVEEFFDEKFSELVAETYEKFKNECAAAKDRLGTSEK